MNRILTVSLALTLLAAGAGQARADNLIVNGGFETGDFTGWKTTPAAAGSDFGVAGKGTLFPKVGKYGPHTGNNYAFFGAVTPLFQDSISQTFATKAGTKYTFSYWLADDGTAPAKFDAYWNGNLVSEITGPKAFGYTLFSFTETATSTTTTIQFSAYQVQKFFSLDDVSVTALPEPPALALVVLGMVVTAGYAWKRRRTTERASN
jgi:hypothetical protein